MADTRPAPLQGVSDAVSWVVFGTGGHAVSVIDVLTRRGDSVHALVGPSAPPSLIAQPVPVWTDDAEAVRHVLAAGLPVIVGIGAPSPRQRILGALQQQHWTGPALVARTATVAPQSTLGAGTVVMEHAHVGPGCGVGCGVIVNTGAVVEHDAGLGDAVHIAPGAYVLGAARVGPRSVIGSGARVLPGVSVGADVTVGAGAVVVGNVPDGATVVGVPARPLVPRPNDSPHHSPDLGSHRPSKETP